MRRRYPYLILSALLILFLMLPLNPAEARKSSSKSKAKTEQTSSKSSKSKKSKKKGSKGADETNSSKSKKKSKNKKKGAKEEKTSKKKYESASRKSRRSSSGASSRQQAAAPAPKKVSKPKEAPEAAQNDSLTVAVNAAVLRWIPSEHNPGGLRINSVKLNDRLREATVGLNENFTYLPINQQFIGDLKGAVRRSLPDSVRNYSIALKVGRH
ncbi:MAG: hypothetical protein ACI305_04250, partial [Lepagella sp.]